MERQLLRKVLLFPVFLAILCIGIYCTSLRKAAENGVTGILVSTVLPMDMYWELPSYYPQNYCLLTSDDFGILQEGQSYPNNQLKVNKIIGYSYTDTLLYVEVTDSICNKHLMEIIPQTTNFCEVTIYDDPTSDVWSRYERKNILLDKDRTFWIKHYMNVCLYLLILSLLVVIIGYGHVYRVSFCKIKYE